MKQDLKDKFSSFLEEVAKKIDRESYQQEPHYTSAFFGKLHNERVKTEDGDFIEMSFSASNDRGPGSAEKKTGIDIGMVFKWTSPETGEIFTKAVLVQAKNKLLDLGGDESNKLSKQCSEMSKLTDSYIVLDCPFDRSIPTICRSSKNQPYWQNNPVRLGTH